MENFLLCSIEQKIIIVKTTEKITVYILKAIKGNEKASKQQRQFLIFDEENKLFEIFEHKVSKRRRSTRKNHKPRSLFMKNIFISLRDILVGSISGAVGTIMTPKLQELYYYLEYIFSKL
ncbi:hypothetical protein [Chryseobacterium sp. ON_d1]|uniref:hypothetical protein n=1 Tax=Chryseobacterium sp. ON_d1 TaxID=2583211 RepID=UPI0011598CBE|nr:hypothetical protein [Chryseobacterium sp. ON_d1]